MSTLTMPHWPTLLFEGRPGTPLDHTRELLAKLGNPEKNLPPTVHVAGTNGKGSTIAFLRAMLESAGLKVHVYTQPHLHRFNERITLASREISDMELFTAIEAARIAAADTPYSFFEGTTAAAFWAFANTPADILLLETGAGGRFDPTNAAENKILTITTTISFDHMDILGHTLSEIAWQKAGIYREDVPNVVSFQAPETHAVLDSEMAAVGAIPCVYGTHWRIQKTTQGMRFSNAGGTYDLPAPILPGPHQYVNAGNALAAATLLDVGIEEKDVIAGLTGAKWPARLERIETGPRAALLPRGWELWLDGGHNMAAGHTLATHIETDWQDKPTHIIFGTTQGKDVASMLAPLQGKIQSLNVVPVASEPKSYSAHTLHDMLASQSIPATPAESVEAAIEKITA
ncbi:MAG: bifunctional folylpolyglutamate synthase/dihydrofolate synthase, partial [Rickettsiales bacterium]|nr:bifunctional folylpolyglutamate synthase/dihydrofolate synthase [Rickettsiales bacterium]